MPGAVVMVTDELSNSHCSAIEPGRLQLLTGPLENQIWTKMFIQLWNDITIVFVLKVKITFIRLFYKLNHIKNNFNSVYSVCEPGHRQYKNINILSFNLNLYTNSISHKYWLVLYKLSWLYYKANILAIQCD